MIAKIHIVANNYYSTCQVSGLSNDVLPKTSVLLLLSLWPDNFEKSEVHVIVF